MFQRLGAMVLVVAAAGCGGATAHHPLHGRWALVAIDGRPVAEPRPVVEVAKAGAVTVTGFDPSAFGAPVAEADLTAAFRDGSQPDGMRVESLRPGAEVAHRTQ